MLLTLLVSCAPSPTETERPRPPRGDSDAQVDSGAPLDTVGGGPVDTGESAEEEEEPVVTEEEVEPQPEDESAAFFDDGVVHTIEITMSSASRASIDADPYTKAPVDVTIDGTTMPDVGIRLRGKIGSFRTMDGKPKFAIDMNFTHEDQRYLGIEELSLNNEVVDCSYMKEPLAYKLFREAGIAAGRTSFATVTVNGEPYGLYVVVETPDDRFLTHNFADPSGTLYDGKYVWFGGYSYILLDFQPTIYNYYQLEEGVDNDHADVFSVVKALGTPSSDAAWYAKLDAVVDMRTFVKYLAVEELVGHNDGYALNTNNNRLYFDPDRGGKMVMVPWDFDYAFLHDSDWGYSWVSPNGDLAYACFHNTECLYEHDRALAEVLDALDVAALQTWYDDRVALIEREAMDDPRRECSYGYVTYYQSYVRGWLDTEPASIRSYWGIE